MEARAVKTGIGSTIFILLIVAALAVVRPVFVRLGEQLSLLEQTAISRIEEKTGLLLEYDSLSPSILSGLNLKGIVLRDAATGKQVAEIRRITVSYRFLDFFSPQPLLAIKNVAVNGITLEYDAVSDGALVEKLLSLRPSGEAGDAVERDEEKRTVDFDSLTFNLPFIVQLKNIALHYSDEHNDAELAVKQLALTSRFDDSGVEIKTEGRVSYRGDYLTDGARRSQLAASFALDGTLFPDLNGSSATVRLLPVLGADYSIANTDLLVNYVDSKLQVRSMRSVLPYSLFFEADAQTKALNASARFDRFDPLSLVRIRRLPPELRKLRGTLLNGTYSATVSAEGGVSYRVNGGVELPPALLGERYSFSAKADGTLEAVRISQLTAASEKLRSEFSGTYDIKRRLPSGTFLLDYFVLPNGNVVSTEVYLEAEGNGFMFVAPQLLLGDRFLTYVRANVIPAANSFDFELAFEDYSHAGDYDTAEVSVAGSLLLGARPHVSANLTVQNLFVDSLLQTAAFFLPTAQAEQLTAVSAKLSPYVFSNEAYFESSLDFKDFSFNMPLFFGANTRKDNELISLAAVGSHETVQLTSLDMTFGKTELTAAVQADFSRGFDDFGFFGEATLNAMPYRFNGNYAAGYLAVSGDYNFDAAVALGELVAGSVSFDAFPVSVGANVVSLSANTRFSWSPAEGAEIDIYSFEIEDASGNVALRPKLALAGTANNYSLVLSSIAYSDAVSVLNGSGNILWNVDDGIFDSIHVDLNAASPLSSEAFTFAVDFVNPMQLPFSMEALQNDFYLSAEASIASFPIGRFLRDQNADNTFTAEITASGTIMNPFVTVSVPQVSLSLAGAPVIAHGDFSLDDSGITVTDIDASWQAMRLSDFEAQFDPVSFTGFARGVFDGTVMNQGFTVPLALQVESAPDGSNRWHLPDNFTLSLAANDISGELFPKPLSLAVTLLRSPGRCDIFSEQGITATLLDDGTITAATEKNAPTRFSLNGKLGGERLQLAFSDLHLDLRRLFSLINFDKLVFNSGIATGDFRIDGLATDPEFNGEITVTNPEFTIPLISPSAFKGKKLVAKIEQSVLTVDPTRFESGRGQLDADVRLAFDRWQFGVLDANLNTVKGKYVPVTMNLPLVHYKGNVGLALQLQLTLNEMLVTGDIYGQNGDIELVTGNWQSILSSDDFDFSSLFAEKTQAEPTALPFDVVADLRITAGNRVQVLYNPFLRGLIVPENQLEFAMDSASGALTLRGDIALRGGEILWLSRNFYMKEGRIVFNETQDNIDPRITVRAETRERDENGSAVTITLTATNQPVSTFNPHFAASPAKSESEVMALLGQVVSADSERASDVAVAGGDYLVNALVMRRIENSLRELGNFDIFSIRTAVLQNAVKQSQRNNTEENQTTFGNFFDNSTVYIGKYFGSSVYVDALMRWTYDETKSNENGDVNRLAFQPDFGFELSSPFVNIRWDIAPDIEEMQKNNNVSLVPATSITLSWKISF